MARGPIDPRLLRHARTSRGGVALLALIGTGQAAATLAIAAALTQLVAPSSSLLFAGTRGGAVALLAGAFTARGLLSWAEQVVARRTAARVTDELRRSLLAAVVGRGPAWVASYGAGRLTTVLGNGLDSLRPWFAGYLPSLVLGVLLPPAVIAVMLLVDPASAVIALLTLPLVPILGALIGWATQSRAKQRWAADARLAGHFLDVVRGLGTLKMYGRAERQTAVIADLTDRHRRATMRVLRVAFLSSTALDLVSTLSVGLVAVQAGIRVASGSMSLAPALLAILLAPEVYRPLREMAARYHAATDATAVIADVDEILTAPLPVRAPAPAAPHLSPEWSALIHQIQSADDLVSTPAGTHGSDSVLDTAATASQRESAGAHGWISSPATTLSASRPAAAGTDGGETLPGAALSPGRREAAGADGGVSGPATTVGAGRPASAGADGWKSGSGTAGGASRGLLVAADGERGVASDGRDGEWAALAEAARWGVLAAGLRASYPGSGGDALWLEELAVRAGEVVALRGESGAGKSTALRVFAGLHPADAGAVAVGRAFHLSQRPALPHARTVGEAFPVDSTAEEVRAALHLVGLASEVTADTALGEHGGGISAGQRQRLALAALLYRAGRAAALTQRATERPHRDEPGPKRRPLPVVTLLLDEPTAHLDPTAELLVVARLKDFAQRGCAVLVVAHRPALLAAADRVVDLHAPLTADIEHRASLAEDADQAGDLSAAPLAGAGTPVSLSAGGGVRAAKPALSTGRNVSGATAGAEVTAGGASSEDEARTAAAAGVRAAGGAEDAAVWWRRGWVAVGLGAGAVLGGMVLTGSAAWLLVRASGLPPVLTLSAAVVLVRGSAVARPLLRYLERLVAHDVAFARLGSRRAGVYTSLIPRIPGARLRRRGDLLTRLVDDVDARVDGLLRGWLPALTAGVVVAVAGAALVGIAPGVAGALGLGLVISGIVAPMVASWQVDRQDAATGVARAALRDAMVETVDGVEELGAGSGRSGVPEERSRTLANLEARAARMSGSASAIAHLGWAVAAAGTALALERAGISAEWSAVVLLGVIALGEPVVALPDAAIARRQAAGAERRVAAMTADGPTTTTDSDDRPSAKGGDGVADGVVLVRGLVAGWDPEGDAALDGVDLELRAGAKVAITGRSGSGKSTFGAVLGGLLAARGGDVRVGGKAVLVGDETGHVFASSVRENLRLASPAVTDPELVAVLRRVGLGSWLAGLPEGLDTWLGTGGSTMSGGQRRRFATARALLAEPALLILDEPTEGIDEAGARELMADLLDAASGRTVLVFAHRGEGLDLVDEIYELSDGRLNVGVL